MKLSEKPTVLITGATGFIGGHVVAALRHSAHILAVGRDLTKGKNLAGDGVSFYAWDLSQPPPASMPATDYVVHIAGLAVPWAPPAEYHRHNVIATENLVRFAEQCSARRIVFVSTSSVYATLQHRYEIPETFIPEKFLSPYAQTKLLAEGVVLKSRVPSVILRPRAVIGPGDTTVLPRLIAAHQSGRLRRMCNNPVITDTTSVHNLVYAIEKALTAHEHACGEVYNITDGCPVDLFVMLNQVFDQLGERPVSKSIPMGLAVSLARAGEVWAMLTGREPALSRYTLSLLGASLTLNIEKARKMLNFNPQGSTKQALAEFVKEYRQQVGNYGSGRH